MKKIFFLLMVCLFQAFFHTAVFAEESGPLPERPKGPQRSKNRIVEIGLLNFNIGISNNFLSVGDIFQETLVLDLSKLKNGYKMKLGFVMYPLYFSYNKNDNWGFGLSIRLDAAGNIGLSGNMLTFREAEKEKSDASGALFIEAGMPFFLHAEKFKIKVKTALFYPLVLTKPDISYTYKTASTAERAETRLNMGFDMRVYTAFPMENFPGEFNITATPGVDFFVEVEYPLSEALGLQDKFSFLDFDAGLAIVNLPLVPSVMYDYFGVSGRVGSEDAIDFFAEDMNWDSFYSLNDTVYGKNRLLVLRPFKMLVWADWRPFENKSISFIPTIGFAYNSLFAQPFSLEAGIKARLDLLNRFIASLGIDYKDRLWKNSLDFIFNSRAFEFDFGLNLQSPSFIGSFTASGIGVNFGIKFGW